MESQYITARTFSCLQRGRRLNIAGEEVKHIKARSRTAWRDVKDDDGSATSKNSDSWAER